MKTALLARTLSVAALVASLTPVASASFTTYTDRPTFTAATGPIATEGFEHALTNQTQFATPLDSTTTNPNVFFVFAGKAFIPGEIIAGFHINSVGSGQAFVGNNIFGGDSTEAISAGQKADNFDLTFDNSNAVGLDFGGSAAAAYTLTAYNGATVLGALSNISLAAGTPGFGGFISSVPITRVNLTEATASGFASFDNVSFNTVPEPTSLGLLALGAGMLGLRRAGAAGRSPAARG